MKKICNKIYDAFDKLLIASKGYEEILVDGGIDKGKLESSGTHEELLKKSTVYKDLYSNETA